MQNDYPAWTEFDILSFNGHYSVGGNPIALLGEPALQHQGLQTAGGQGATINVPIRLDAPQVWTTSGNGPLTVGAVDLNGNTLTVSSTTLGTSSTTINGPITGTGNVLLFGGGLYLRGGGTMNGAITVDIADLTVDGSSLPVPITLDGGQVVLSGNTTVGSFTATNRAGVLKTSGGGGNLITNTGNLSMTANTSVVVDLLNESPGQSTQINVTGSVSLGGSHLSVSTGGTIFPVGTSFTIINNDGAEPVGGTFAGLPEGAIVIANGNTTQQFQITYAGGSGNDVVLTAVPPVPVLNQWMLTTLAVVLAGLALLRLRH